MDFTVDAQKNIINAAMGKIKADTVFKNAQYFNSFTKELCRGDVAIYGGVIIGVDEEYSGENEINMEGKLLLPGLIDSHIHIESSAVTPKEFAKAAVRHGTTTVITDPHEIANVLGTDGIDYMLKASENLPVDFCFCLPSCVPATPFEMGGFELTAEDIAPYFKSDRVVALAEMMNYVGTVQGDEGVLDKLSVTKKNAKPIDGHAPELSGYELNAYTAAGISTDHECFELSDALQKLARGQKILIREGTAAQNLDALLPLLCPQYGSSCMLATDDKHPDGLLDKGHIDYIVKKAMNLGADPASVLLASSYNAAQHYRLFDRGAIAPGYKADLIIVDSLENFNVLSVYKNGCLVFNGDRVAKINENEIPKDLENRVRNTMNMKAVTCDAFKADGELGLVGLVKGQIITKNLGFAKSVSVENDILKIAVIERHHGKNQIGIGYIHGYGLKNGAVATSIAHDSHNLIVVGATDEDMAFAANKVREMGGGIAVCRQGKGLGEVCLPIAGLMSDKDIVTVRDELDKAKAAAYSLGVSFDIDPFMTLSFVSLPVIPELRVTTGGVFDAVNFKYL